MLHPNANNEPASAGNTTATDKDRSVKPLFYAALHTPTHKLVSDLLSLSDIRMISLTVASEEVTNRYFEGDEPDPEDEERLAYLEIDYENGFRVKVDFVLYAYKLPFIYDDSGCDWVDVFCFKQIPHSTKDAMILFAETLRLSIKNATFGVNYLSITINSLGFPFTMDDPFLRSILRCAGSKAGFYKVDYDVADGIFSKNVLRVAHLPKDGYSPL